MKIADFLSAPEVALDVRASDKVALLKELADRTASSLGLSAAAVASALEKRDELGSTGIGGGVSLPHARFREVKKPFGFLARLKRPIEFDAVDGQPVDLVFLLLLPASSQLDQLNALAAVARKMRDREVLSKLRSATSVTELYRAITQ